MRPLLLLFLLLSACIPSPAAAPTAAEFYPIQAATVQPPPSEAPSHQAPNLFIRSVERSGKEVRLEVCFTPPDAADWTLGQVHLVIAGNELTFQGSTLTELSFQNSLPLRRCEQLNFAVPPEMILSLATLQIDAIQSYPSLDELCTLYFPKLTPRWEAQGVHAECQQTPDGWQVRLVSYPPNLSAEQAEALIYDPANFAIAGPWKFTLQFTP